MNYAAMQFNISLYLLYFGTTLSEPYKLATHTSDSQVGR
jgi:hypothetical protein